MTTTTEPDVFVQIARDFVKRYRTNSGCSHCGGLPHTTACFVGRFEVALHTAPESDRVPVLEQAIGNCYMMAKRQISAHLRGTTNPQQDVKRWEHVLRFCETTGSKSSILRQIPTEIAEGSNCTCGFSLPCPAHGVDDVSPPTPSPAPEDWLDDYLDAMTRVSRIRNGNG